MKFNELKISEDLLSGIDAFNFETMTEIQAKSIPVALSGKDLLACSQTGSGKTAAFLIPVMEKISGLSGDGIKSLIICPTREICMQTEEQVSGLGYFTGTSCIAIYGGNDQDGFSRQKAALTNGVDVVVATPGRLISHLSLGYVKTEDLKFLVLDEADEMLDMGFYDDIINIISYLPHKRQTLMFSATMPDAIRKLASKILYQPEILDLNFSKPAEEIDQKVYLVYEKDKASILANILYSYKGQRIIIFAGTKINVSKVSSHLRMIGIKNTAINSSFSQQERNEKMLDFKNGKTDIVVTTNLLARGIDIDDVNLIVNYDIPDKAEDYVHRI
ncbi:MAG: ATP-dependent RNA helicase [Marinilabiliales bacterium]|nr:MAG: ATP-dependent RNA helicase [Marinilabiliales bacterium]